MSTILDDLAAEEARLVFSRFDADTAFELGRRLRDAARRRGGAVAIEVAIAGRTLFFAAMPGTTADNAGWIARKRAVVERFEHSSWYMKHLYEMRGTTIVEKSLLPLADYAPFGGAHPIRVAGVGQIGVVTVSGLPQAEDHRLVVETLAELLAATPADADAGVAEAD